MFCPNCGIHNEDSAFKCGQCGHTFMRFNQQAQEEIFTWLVPGIIATVCCCLPFGITSVVYAAKASAFLESGNLAMAAEKARMAKIWFWVSFAVGIPAAIMIMMLNVLGALAEMAEQSGGF